MKHARFRPVRSAAFAVALVTATAVASVGCRRAVIVEMDPWLAAPTGEAVNDRASATPIPPESIGLVDANHRHEVERMLDDRTWVELADSSAATLTGSPVRAPDDGKHRYLVRGMVLSGTEATGRFSVAQAGSGDVFVHWGCLGRGKRNDERRPLVVVLPRAPRYVYVTTSMAE